MSRKRSPSKDPYAEREAQKYARPIPSREFIQALLTQADKPLTFEEIAHKLKLTDSIDCESLQRRLNAMVRDGQIVLNRREGYLPVDERDLVRGRVLAHPDGFGFLRPDEGGGEDIFLSPRERRALMHSDRAVVRVSGVDARGRREGLLIEVIERNTVQVVGRFQREAGVGMVLPDDKRMHQNILIPENQRGGAEEGQIVVVQLTQPPTRQNLPIGRVSEILGAHLAPGMEIDVAVRVHGLPTAWPDAVAAEAALLPSVVDASLYPDRVDLRELLLVTIDGEDARDFDDAVHCCRTAKGWRLWVAIADVSSYVQPDTALDGEARSRGTSVYFPNRVIPMLPEALSNGLCSLNPQVDRLCLVAELYITQTGQLLRTKFYSAVMNSKARFTYTRVAALLAGDPPGDAKETALLPHLFELHQLYRVLHQAREQRGAIDFDTQETKICFGDNGKIAQIVPVTRNDAHRLIEECMIMANVAAARFLQRQKIPALYRVHAHPNKEKLRELRILLTEMGLDLGSADPPTPADYSKVLRGIRGRPDAHMLQSVLLRSLAQAVYSPTNSGHFGLALEHYAHFTSPIRRYPDLVVHRAIYHALAGGKPREFIHDPDELAALGEHCSANERRADEATRDAVSWLKCEYMLDKQGEVFDGVVTGVTPFGLFVELANIYVDGLVHITQLKRDYYEYDPVRHTLRGRQGGRVYRLTDRVQVQVARVNLDDRKIDLLLADETTPKKGKKRDG